MEGVNFYLLYFIYMASMTNEENDVNVQLSLQLFKNDYKSFDINIDKPISPPPTYLPTYLFTHSPPTYVLATYLLHTYLLTHTWPTTPPTNKH
jgi:hypothetical protein